MSKRNKVLLVAGSVAALAGIVLLVGCISIKRRLVVALDPTYSPSGDSAAFVPTFPGGDGSRARIDVTLTQVVRGITSPTDLQFVPSQPDLLWVLEKEGTGRWFSLEADKASGVLFELEVLSDSEQGLLGLAFHPRFSENGRFFLNYSVESKSTPVNRIEEWSLPPESDPRTGKPMPVRILLEVEDLYPNHNAGQLAFGPDGYLYIGTGDGGFRDDPHNHGQNPGTLLGSMLRIDVDSQAAGKPYGIPADNPWLNTKGFLPELYAIGLRNPWRYSFAPSGQLVLADVGQNRWEEVNLIEKGGNYGWATREAAHCFKPAKSCRTEGLTDPIYEYGREDGMSITGGYVYASDRIPKLTGKYVFGDFVSGRLWAIDLPKSANEKSPPAFALGKWPFLPSTFGRDARGQVYVADFTSGTVYRLDP